MLETITSEMTPPDRLMSAAYRWTGDDLAQVKKIAGQLPAAIIRAKGFLSNRKSNYLFSYVMGDWSLEPCEISSDRIQHMNIVVFIGPPESIAALDQITASGSWSQVSTYQPPA